MNIQEFSSQDSQFNIFLNDKSTSFINKDFPTNTGIGNMINWLVIAYFDSITELPFFHVKAHFSGEARGGGEGYLGVNFCWVCAAGLSESLPHFSVNLLAHYHECRALIGYATHYLFCDR